MMLGTTYEYGTIRRYVAVFGSLFNAIYINRSDPNNNKQTIKVPLTYAPKEKMLNRLTSDPNLDRPVAMTLPRMSFEMTSFEYDSMRKLNSVGKYLSTPVSANTAQHSYQYNPVPWNIYFNLYIMVKNAEDGTKIVEQILPFFTPEYTITVKIDEALDTTIDVPIVLLSTTLDDVYEGSYEERRAMIWTISFVLKGQLFGPTKKQGLIKTALTNFYSVSGDIDDAVGNTTVAETVTIRPGLTANGTPTSNSSLTVPLNEISPDDAYGFIITFDRGSG